MNQYSAGEREDHGEPPWSVALAKGDGATSARLVHIEATEATKNRESGSRVLGVVAFIQYPDN